MILNDHSKVIVDSKPFEFLGHTAYGVRDRQAKRLIGHVARSEFGVGWVYLFVADHTWTGPCVSRKDAVDHLLSADHPQAAWLR